MPENTGTFNPRVVLNGFGGCLNGDFLKTRMFWGNQTKCLSSSCLDRVVESDVLLLVVKLHIV